MFLTNSQARESNLSGFSAIEVEDEHKWRSLCIKVAVICKLVPSLTQTNNSGKCELSQPAFSPLFGKDMSLISFFLVFGNHSVTQTHPITDNKCTF